MIVRVAAEQSFGAISALAISPESDCFICSFASGRVEFWDLEKGSRLKAITDCHSVAVVFLQFLDTGSGTNSSARNLGLRKQFVVLSIDLRGVGYLLSISKMLMVHVVDSKCLLDGTSGKIKAFAIHERTQLVALSSLSECFLVSISTGGQDAKVAHVWPAVRTHKPVREGSLPSLSWHTASLDEMTTPKPTLARAMGRQVDFLQYHAPAQNENATSSAFDSTIRKQYRSDEDVTALEWLNESMLALLTVGYKLVIVDVIGLIPMESVQIGHVQLVWTRFSAAENSFHQSFIFAGGCLNLLGMKRLTTVKVRTWMERVNSMIGKGKWLHALALALDQYQLNGKRERNRMAEIILQFATRGNLDKLAAGACIEFCTEIERTDLLFGAIYDCFVSDGAASRIGFLEVLRSYILNRLVTGIGPSVLHDFVYQFQQDGRTAEVEQCIIHLDPVTIRSDLDTLVKLSKKYRLWSALIYLYNTGLHDWETPVRVILDAAAKQEPAMPLDEQLRLMRQVMDTVPAEATQENPLWESQCLSLIHKKLPQVDAVTLAIERLSHHRIAGGLSQMLMKDVMTRVLIAGKEKTMVNILRHCDPDSYDLEEVKTHVNAYGWRTATAAICQQALDVALQSAANDKRIQEAYVAMLDVTEKPVDFCNKQLSQNLPQIARPALQSAIVLSLKRLLQLQPEETEELIAKSQVVTDANELAAFPTLQYVWMRSKGVDQAHCARYIELMCELEPSAVYAYLKSNEGVYPLEEALETCRKNGIKDGCSFLLERMGDANGALGLILEEIGDRVREDDSHALHSAVNVAVEMCERSSLTCLDPADAQKLWFRLLDKVVGVSENDPGVLQGVLNRMVSHVDSQSLVNLVKSREFGHLRQAVRGMLHAKYLEIDTLRISSRLVANDMMQLVKKKHNLLTHGERLDKLPPPPPPKEVSRNDTVDPESNESWFVDWEARLEVLGEFHLPLEPPL